MKNTFHEAVRMSARVGTAKMLNRCTADEVCHKLGWAAGRGGGGAVAGLGQANRATTRAPCTPGTAQPRTSPSGAGCGGAEGAVPKEAVAARSGAANRPRPWPLSTAAVRRRVLLLQQPNKLAMAVVGELDDQVPRGLARCRVE